MRVGIRTVLSLALCAAAAGAALAHYAIDVVGDYALARDSYDHLQHGSREILTAIALILAVVLAARGLAFCCELAAINRTRLLRPQFGLLGSLTMLLGSVAASVAIVPGMEYLDGRLDGVPVRHLDDAFGGSIVLGLGTALICAALVAVILYALARWLISHHDVVVAIIVVLLRPLRDPSPGDRYGYIGRQRAPRKRRPPISLRLSKRGPPATAFA